MAQFEVECSLCLSTCSHICYQGHKTWYACHNRECALHYPENVEIDADGRFVLGGGGGTYQPRRERSPRASPDTHRPRLRDALRSLLCGLSGSGSTSPARNQRRATQHNTPPSRDNTPPLGENTPPPRHNPPSPRNNRGSSQNPRASRQPRRSPRQNNDGADDTTTVASSMDLPPLTRQENGRRRLYRDTSDGTTYTIVLERQGDASMNLRSIMRNGEPL